MDTVIKSEKSPTKKMATKESSKLSSLKQRIQELEKENRSLADPEKLVAWLSSIHPANMAFEEGTTERVVAEAISKKMWGNIHAMRAAFKRLVVDSPNSEEAEMLFDALKDSIHIGGVPDASSSSNLKQKMS